MLDWCLPAIALAQAGMLDALPFYFLPAYRQASFLLSLCASV